MNQRNQKLIEKVTILIRVIIDQSAFDEAEVAEDDLEPRHVIRVDPRSNPGRQKVNRRYAK